MAYHEAFWVAAAAAAPIIALANQITLSDRVLLAQAFELFRRIPGSILPRGAAAWATLLIGYVNMGFQAGILSSALYSLANEHDFRGFSTDAVTLAEAFGILALILTAVSTGTVRMVTARAEATRLPPEDWGAGPPG